MPLGRSLHNGWQHDGVAGETCIGWEHGVHESSSERMWWLNRMHGRLNLHEHLYLASLSRQAGFKDLLGGFGLWASSGLPTTN